MVKLLGPHRRLVKPEKNAYAKQMRRNPTPPEEALWEYFRAKRMGCSVRRQHVIFGWIADFWCPAARLVIEVDGQRHSERQAQDAHRDSVLAAKGVMTLRIAAREALADPRRVADQVRQVILSRRAQAEDECETEDGASA